MNLFVAKETVLIFTHEIYENGFSQAVDRHENNRSRIATSQEEVGIRASTSHSELKHCRFSFYLLEPKIR